MSVASTLACGSRAAVPNFYRLIHTRNHRARHRQRGLSNLRYQPRSIVDAQAIDHGRREQARTDWLTLIELAYCHSRRASIAAGPPFHQPCRMAQPLGDRRCAFDQRLPTRGLARQRTQHGVHHARCLRLARCARKLNAFADGGMCWNAVHMQQLQRAQTQRGQHRGRRFDLRPLEVQTNARIERNLPAQHAQHKRVRQIDVNLR
jgi:hypothetical protein